MIICDPHKSPAFSESQFFFRKEGWLGEAKFNDLFPSFILFFKPFGHATQHVGF